MQSKAGDRRRVGLAVRRACGNGALLDQGLPKSLQAFVGEVMLGLQPGSDELHPATKQGVVSKPMSTSAFLFLKAAVVTEEPLAACRSLVSSVGDRLPKAIRRCASAIDSSSAWCASVRLKPKSSDEYRELKWIPTGLTLPSAKPFKPLALDKHGAPTVFAQKKFGLRYTHDEFAWQGIGSIIVGLQGQCALLGWPYASTLRAGGAPKEGVAMIEGLSSTEASRFMAEEATYVVIEALATALGPRTQCA